MDSPASEATKARFRKKAYILSGGSCKVLLISSKNPPAALGRQFLHIPHKQIYKYKNDTVVWVWIKLTNHFDKFLKNT